MSPKLTATLLADFPLVFPPNFHFECDDGWYDLIHRLSAKLEDLIKSQRLDTCECGYLDTSHPQPECTEFVSNHAVAAQVKEKFSGLRFYLDGVETEEMTAAIQLAEDDSFKVCEICGDSGSLRQRKWLLKTLCDRCAAK